MSRARSDTGSPTMIIPRGAEIRLDAEGQLSIRTPGNLVLEASGNYGVLESFQGSIRIEPGAEIEAVLVRSAHTCVVAGSLTAWKVEARTIELENDARANIMLQQTEHLEIGHDARLVGNFSSEKELFLMFSRFARQLRAMPLFAEQRDAAPGLDAPAAVLPAATPSNNASPASANGGLPDGLRRALELLDEEATAVDRTAGTAGTAATADRTLERIAKLLRDHDVETLAATHRTLFLRVPAPSERILQASRLVAEHFQAS